MRDHPALEHEDGDVYSPCKLKCVVYRGNTCYKLINFMLRFFAVIRRITMTINESIIREVVGKILTVAHPERVILFGSAATGAMSPDSDVDLLVIEKDVENPRDETLKIRKALSEFEVPFDVIVMASERFEETRNVIGGIAYPANKYGKVIYEAA